MTKTGFTALARNVRACRLCEAALPAGPRPVFQMHPEARVLIAGQAPGRRVHESGVPFDDPSGERLRDWMGIGREAFYDPRRVAILPMGFCYPGTGKSGDLPPRPECAGAWRAQMLAFLPGVRLTLVIGQYALDWHLKDRQGDTLTDMVRNWKAFWPKLLPLPHPSPRNNIWLKKNPWFDRDVLPGLRARVGSLLRA
ncbi:MAG: uracil-DNA glycosylase family protein [Reyranella sp.]|nr:uracil-DNA glycosylase family protein [Reyranella sp.]